jgi:DNA-binding SARP family transcriptional activator
MANRPHSAVQLRNKLEIDLGACLRICLLGRFRILRGAKSIGSEQIHSHKARDLLKLLALAPDRQLHREQLLEMLWPEHAPESAAHNLRQILYVLRPKLQELDSSIRIQFEDERLVLSAAGGISTDVEGFEQMARLALGLSDTTDSEAAVACQSAIVAYSGDLLPEDGPSELFYPRRDELCQLYLYLLLRLGKYQL